MAVDAALFSGSKCYFFDGNRYLRVTRGDTGAGTVDAGYPAPISNWGWPAGFGSRRIDAALYSGSKCYFFRGNQYVRVTRGDTGAGTVDPGYPAPISNWGWPAGSAATGIDAALYSGSKCYFFRGSAIHPGDPRRHRARHGRRRLPGADLQLGLARRIRQPPGSTPRSTPAPSATSSAGRNTSG